MKAIGYIRVSTDTQAREGVSLDAQRQSIIDYCKANDLELVEIARDDGISGARADNRPGLQLAIELVCRNKGVLITYSLSRFARSVIDAVTIIKKIEKCGGQFASLTEQIDTRNAMGKFVFVLMSAIGELERNQISERTTAALRYKQSRGEKVGGHVPFGFEIDEEKSRMETRKGVQKKIHMLRPNLPEQMLIGHMLHMNLKLGVGNVRIAQHLNEIGVLPRCGKPWTRGGVNKIIAREREKAT